MKETQFHALCYAISVFLFAIGHTKIQSLSFITGIMVTYGKFVPVGLSSLALTRRRRFNTRTLAIMLIFLLLLVLSFFSHDLSYTVFFIAFFMIACSRSEPRQIFKFYTLTIFTVLGLTLVLTFLGVLENDNSWYGRYDLGFTYCTFGPNLFLSACFALVCWKKENVSWKWWLFVLLLNQFFFWKTSTDAVYICVIILFVLWIGIRFHKMKYYIERSRPIQFLFSHGAIILAIATIVFQVYYNTHSTSVVMIWLNTKLSTRLYMGLRVFERYSTGGLLIKELILGLDTELVSYLDSSYLAILTQFGIPVLLSFCFWMDVLGSQAYEAKDYYLSISILVFMIHCITDPQLSSFRCNPLIITALFYYKQRGLPVKRKVP